MLLVGIGSGIATAQVPAGDAQAPGEETAGYQIQLEPPGAERLFGIFESEAKLQERMRQEALQRPVPERIQFPDQPVLSREPYSPRTMPPSQAVVEPAYVCYRRLYFEQKNPERYGWDLGFIHPVLSMGHFFLDVAVLPYRLGIPRKYECNAGYLLPGDPVPLMLYPVELSVTGLMTQAGTCIMGFVIFPP